MFLAPLSVYEVALDLIQAGFTPSKSHFLREKMKYVIDQSIKSAIEGFHVSLPEGKSAEAYVIPGPYIFLIRCYPNYLSQIQRVFYVQERYSIILQRRSWIKSSTKSSTSWRAMS